MIASGIAPIANGAPQDKRLSEPTIGLLVDPDVVKFEPVPKSEYDAMGFHADDRWWIMAEYDDSRASGNIYYVVSGVRHPELDTDPPQRDMKGYEDASYVMTKDKGGYKVLGYAADYAVGADTFGIPPRVLQKLAEDAWARLLKAFGSKAAVRAEFLKETKGSNGPDPLDPYMFKILKAQGFPNICLAADDPANAEHCVKQ